MLGKTKIFRGKTRMQDIYTILGILKNKMQNTYTIPSYLHLLRDTHLPAPSTQYPPTYLHLLHNTHLPAPPTYLTCGTAAPNCRAMPSVPVCFFLKKIWKGCRQHVLGGNAKDFGRGMPSVLSFVFRLCLLWGPGPYSEVD